MGDETRESAAAGTPPASHFSGAFGAGFVLVVLPGVALVVFLPWFDDKPSIGLPIVAVFGIMILFGAMALVSTLFARLQLDNKLEALALPAGSVRAFIALALIVLFALISVMLFESFGQPYKIENLSEESKAALVKEPTNHVSAVIPVCAAASASSTATPAPAAVARALSRRERERSVTPPPALPAADGACVASACGHRRQHKD